jgi:hypothetical protein
MAKHYLLARLGGADARMLADEEIASQTGERTRFVAMGGVLLTTAGVAALSMFFALHHAVGLSTGWSIPFALAWGIVIINIDRFLIITMTGSRGHPVRLIVTVLIRLVLATLIAIVVATPIVLQVFASDIKAELPVIQQQQSAAFVQSQAHDGAENQLAKDNAQIKVEQGVADGNGETQVATYQATVSRLTPLVIHAKNAESVAFAKLQCEQGGVKGSECPPGTSGSRGFGPLAKADQAAYNNSVQNYNVLNSQLVTAKNDLATATTAATQKESAAQQQVTMLTNAANKERATINAAIVHDTKENAQDTGLLEQIHALFAASDVDSGLAWAHWIVTGLFFVIEILPVTIKCLLLLGDETPYEQIAAKRGEAAVDQAQVTIDAEMEVMRTRAQSKRDIADLEAQAAHDIREAALASDLAIVQDKEQARQGVETDFTRREKGTRIEANKRFNSATRDHILAAIDDWALQIREAIRLGTQQPATNGKAPHPPGQTMSSSNGPSGGV